MNRPFTRWRCLTTTIRIHFAFAFLFKFVNSLNLRKKTTNWRILVVVVKWRHRASVLFRAKSEEKRLFSQAKWTSDRMECVLFRDHVLAIQRCKKCHIMLYQTVMLRKRFNYWYFRFSFVRQIFDMRIFPREQFRPRPRDPCYFRVIPGVI